MRSLHNGGHRVVSLVLAGAVASVTLATSQAMAAGNGHVGIAPAVSGWKSSRLPMPAGALPNSFMPAAISCYSATVCSGGGGYASISGHHAALLHWSTGVKWTAVEAQLPAGAADDPRAAVTSMSCPSASRCFAGGNYSDGGNRAMVLTWSSAAGWSVRKAPLPAGASPNPDAAVGGMSCPSVTWCTGVGQYSDADGNEDPLLLRRTGGTWTAKAAPVRPPDGQHLTAGLTTVACPSTSRCFAGGWQYDSAGQPVPLMLTWFAGRWMAMKVPLPVGAAVEPSASIGGISCSTTAQCVAVGHYVGGRENQQGFILTWSGTSWTARKAPLPSDAGGNPWTELDAVSCPATSRCVAGGAYETAASQSLGMLLTWSGKTWTAATAPAAAYRVSGISCPSLAKCVAVSPGISRPVVLVGSQVLKPGHSPL